MLATPETSALGQSTSPTEPSVSRAGTESPQSAFPVLVALTDDSFAAAAVQVAEALAKRRGAHPALRYVMELTLSATSDGLLGVSTAAMMQELLDVLSHAALVIMGLHHHGAIGRALGNDTVREIRAFGGVPVLVVRPQLVSLPKSVAVDFSQASVPLTSLGVSWMMLARGISSSSSGTSSTLPPNARKGERSSRRKGWKPPSNSLPRNSVPVQA